MVKRRLTKEELERISTARKGRLITPTQSRKVGRAVTGILGALLPPEAMAGSVSYAKKGTKGDRGRGRPHRTYKTRFVPGYGTVRVPTHIYRKMMSEAKAKRRLAVAQQQAGIREQYESEQIAAVQRQAYEAPDQFLESPDSIHDARVMQMEQDRQIQRQVEQMPRPSGVQRVGRGISRVGQGVNNLMNQIRQRQYQQQQRIAQRQMEQGISPQQTMPQAGQQYRQQAGQQVSPQLRILSDKSSILNAPNIFNNPGSGNLLFPRRR